MDKGKDLSEMCENMVRIFLKRKFRLFENIIKGSNFILKLFKIFGIGNII